MSTTMTLRLDDDTNDRLANLAGATDSSIISKITH